MKLPHGEEAPRYRALSATEKNGGLRLECRVEEGRTQASEGEEDCNREQDSDDREFDAGHPLIRHNTAKDCHGLIPTGAAQETVKPEAIFRLLRRS